MIVERVTGQRYDALLDGRFFARLGMRTSFARPPRQADWKGERTMGYRWSDSAWKSVDVFDLEAFVGGMFLDTVAVRNN